MATSQNRFSECSSKDAVRSPLSLKLVTSETVLLVRKLGQRSVAELACNTLAFAAFSRHRRHIALVILVSAFASSLLRSGQSATHQFLPTSFRYQSARPTQPVRPLANTHINPARCPPKAHAPTWATLRGTHLTETPWLNRFCALLPPVAEILDIGCGSGQPLAADLIRRGHRITGLDGSPAMLALFRRNLPNTPAHLADMRHLSLNRRFAGLLAWDSFFHLSPDDQRATLPRFAAHAAPGAPLMFTSGDTEGEAIGDLEGTPLYHASLDPAEYRTRLAAAGFTILAHISQDPICRRTVWLAQRNPP